MDICRIKRSELLRNRLDLAATMRDYVGKYYSVEYIKAYLETKRKRH